jgi:hypothetical protein
MYLCMVSNSGVEPNENTTANSNWTAEKPWASAEYREFTASKVLFAARGKIENADIDDVTIRGTITEDCQSLTDRVLIMGSAVSGQETRLRSVLSALTLDDPDDPTVIPEWTRCSRTNNQIIQLPTYLETLIGGIDYKSNPYQIAGTKISIYTTPDVNLLNWWCNDFYDDNHVGDTNYAAVMNEGVLVCADPDSLLGEIEDVGGLVRVRPRHLWNGMQLKEGEGTHGRFSFRGRVARFVLLLPGQHLDLESQIQYMPKYVTEPYSELTYEPTLVWNIVNAADFDAIDINMNINVPVVGVSAAANGAYFSRVSSVSGAGMTGGNEVFVCNKLIYEKAGVEQSLQLNLNVTLAGHFENGGSESDVDLPSWAFAITHPTS